LLAEPATFLDAAGIAIRKPQWVAARGEIGARTHWRMVAPGARCRHTRYPKEADMPYGIYPVPTLHPNPSPATDAAPSFTLRLRTWWKRHRLDEQLSRGADPASTAELGLRSAQLRSRAVRSDLADALVERLNNARLVEPLMVKVRLQYRDILDCADELMALVQRLRDERPVEVRGAAVTARLLTDRAGPLYRPGGPSLRDALRSARLALDVSAPAGQDLRVAA
jgi:hypothetical protein